MAAPDPRPAKRIVDPSAGVEKLRREGRCRVCHRVGTPASEGGWITRAHLVGRGQRGDDVDDNIVPLCGSGNTGCHGAFDGQTGVATAPSLQRGVVSSEIRHILLSRLTPAEVAYMAREKSDAWIVKRFS